MWFAGGCYNDNNLGSFAPTGLLIRSKERRFRQRQLSGPTIFEQMVDFNRPTDLPLFALVCHLIRLLPPWHQAVQRGKFYRIRRRTYRNEARAMLPLLIDLIEKLKAEGIYDQTAILLPQLTMARRLRA